MKAQYKTGIVREVDGARGLARVEFPDEDGVASWWLSVSSAFTGGSKSYAMPEVGSQVSCLTDERGEEGLIIGAIYSDKDTPPSADPNEIAQVLAGGRESRYNKKTGEMSIKQKAPLTLEIGAAKAVIAPDSITFSLGGVSFAITSGGVAIKGGKLTHEGKNIGSTHMHGGVKSGSDKTQAPE